MSFTWEHVLYRFYAKDGALLYVGITNSITTRFKGHAATQPWWPEVADCRVAFYPDWPALARAEHDAIRYERPRYNRNAGSKQPVVAAARRRPEPPAPKNRPLAPCMPTDVTKPWQGCTCRSQAEHYGDYWPLVEGGSRG
jgi:hypothetical protein